MDNKRRLDSLAPVPQLKDVVDDAAQRRKLSAYIVARNAIRLREAALSEVKAKLNQDIEELMLELGIDAVQHGALRLSRFKSHSSTIKREILMRLNVSPNVIAEATVRKEFTVIKVADMSKDEEE